MLQPRFLSFGARVSARPGPRLRPCLWGAALAALLLATGCSSLDVPRADNYPASDQKKARAVHHWNVLADDVATRIADKIRDWPAGEHPIHVSASGDSAFHTSLRRLLVARLLDRGVVLSNQPTNVSLVIETQLVEHVAPVSNRSPMPLTRLAAGVIVARDWHRYMQSNTSMGLGVAALGVLGDAALYATDGPAAGGPTRTEVLVTATLESGDRLLARTADIYYIEPEDATLYRPPAPPPPAPPPVPLKTWQVVNPS